jgi:hypothetical protein
VQLRRESRKFIVVGAGWEVGWSYEDMHGSQRWYRAIIVIGASQAGIGTSGRANSLEEAKVQFHANYRQWLVAQGGVGFPTQEH